MGESQQGGQEIAGPGASVPGGGPTTPRGRRAAVLRRLDRDWEALRHDVEASRACERWVAQGDVLRGCATPGDVLDRVRSDADAVLLLLLVEAGSGDEVAARLVLQALLPKVVLMAARDRCAEVDDYVTALWCSVVTYPVHRRPTSVAANLALDTLKAVRRDRRPPADLAMPPHVVVVAADRRPTSLVGGPAVRGPVAEQVLDRAREHGLVDPRTRALLHTVYAEGVPGDLAARRHGLTPGALRSRCSRALRVLADHRDLLDVTS